MKFSLGIKLTSHIEKMSFKIKIAVTKDETVASMITFKICTIFPVSITKYHCTVSFKHIHLFLQIIFHCLIGTWNNTTPNNNNDPLAFFHTALCCCCEENHLCWVQYEIRLQLKLSRTDFLIKTISVLFGCTVNQAHFSHVFAERVDVTTGAPNQPELKS